MSGLATHYDARGLAVSDCQAQSLDDYETALVQFQSYFGDPTETLSKTLESDPEFVLAHIFIASALMTMSERQYLPMVREHVEKAEALGNKANDREKRLTLAARQMLDGDWDKASLTWDEILSIYPRDVLALQLGHLLDFYRGDNVNLRDRICRVMHRWDITIPGYSYLIGMQAFGFEECNQYERAEILAHAALDIEARDAWSVHALAHVLEMQGRFEEGKHMFRSREQDWAPDNGFAAHNWWHLALFHLEHEDFEGALNLYDEKILPEESDVSLQLLDGSALLWRLQLEGIDVGDRWNKNADMWAKKTTMENGYYAFNDLHALLSFVASGREAEASRILTAVEDAALNNKGVTAMMANDVGIATCRAMVAFGQGRHDDVIELLLPVRTIAHRFGGSHAQRDILTQTVIESALRSGKVGLAKNLIGERMVHKPLSPFSNRLWDKLDGV